jgi:hypothetical protein
MWHNKQINQVRDCQEIVKTFVMGLFFGHLLSVNDVGSDSYMFKLFLFGDDYKKTVPTKDDPYVT